MYGYPASIKRSNTSGRHDHNIFMRSANNLFQQGSFTRTGLPGKEYRFIGLVDKTQRITGCCRKGLHCGLYLNVKNNTFFDILSYRYLKKMLHKPEHFYRVREIIFSLLS
jgi:hypothetical protein